MSFDGDESLELSLIKGKRVEVYSCVVEYRSLKNLKRKFAPHVDWKDQYLIISTRVRFGPNERNRLCEEVNNFNANNNVHK